MENNLNINTIRSVYNINYTDAWSELILLNDSNIQKNTLVHVSEITNDNLDKDRMILKNQ